MGSSIFKAPLYFWGAELSQIENPTALDRKVKEKNLKNFIESERTKKPNKATGFALYYFYVNQIKYIYIYIYSQMEILLSRKKVMKILRLQSH